MNTEQEKRQPDPERPEQGREDEDAAQAADAAFSSAPDTELQRLQDQLTESRNQTLRAQAELDNFRKRLRREMEDERRYAAAPLVADLLPVLDNLERALKSAESQEGAGLVAGVKMVAHQFRDVLQRHHCTVIAAEGEPFDPNVHEAIAQHPSDDHEPGSVMHVTQTGYRMHDRVIRPAQVVVAAPKPSESS